MNSESNKREIIMEAAIKEFAQKGYKGASTNAICKNAGVSKGLLFHYYKDKFGLFYECFQKSLQEFNKITDIDRVIQEKDLFKRLVLWLEEKEKFVKGRKEMASFVMEAYTIMEEEGFEHIKAIYNEAYNEFDRKLLQGIDISGLRTDLDQHLVIEYILKGFEVISGLILSEYGSFEVVEDYEKVRLTLDKFIDMLKYGIYKQQDSF